MSDDELDASSPEWQPRRVMSRSPLRPTLGVLGLGLAIVVIAVATKANVPTTGPVDRPRNTPPVAAAATAQPARRDLPATLDCNDLDRAECAAMTRVALDALPGDVPPAAAAGVWASLLCGSVSDCPPAEMRGATPRGSVVLQFADGGPEAWLNVVDRPAGGGSPETVAWIARWEEPVSRSLPPLGDPPPGLRLLPM
jgi:hypothetical protein